MPLLWAIYILHAEDWFTKRFGKNNVEGKKQFIKGLRISMGEWLKKKDRTRYEFCVIFFFLSKILLEIDFSIFFWPFFIFQLFFVMILLLLLLVIWVGRRRWHIVVSLFHSHEITKWFDPYVKHKRYWGTYFFSGFYFFQFWKWAKWLRRKKKEDISRWDCVVNFYKEENHLSILDYP